MAEKATVWFWLCAACTCTAHVHHFSIENLLLRYLGGSPNRHPLFIERNIWIMWPPQKKWGCILRDRYPPHTAHAGQKRQRFDFEFVICMLTFLVGSALGLDQIQPRSPCAVHNYSTCDCSAHCRGPTDRQPLSIQRNTSVWMNVLWIPYEWRCILRDPPANCLKIKENKVIMINIKHMCSWTIGNFSNIFCVSEMRQAKNRLKKRSNNWQKNSELYLNNESYFKAVEIQHVLWYIFSDGSIDFFF
jgi:hypothetical protein